MNDDDKKRFAEIMWGLADNFGASVTKEGLSLRFEALKAYSIEQISRAATRLLIARKETYPPIPKVSEFIEAIENNGRQKVEHRQKAEIQANVVLDYLKQYGRAGHASFEDPITQHLMTTRWKYKSWAATVPESELKWWRKEFIEAYEAFSSAQEAGYKPIEPPEALRSLADKSIEKVG